MDLTQSKLSKAEWESIETPVSETEKKILRVIMNGYDALNIRYNENQSMLQLLHMNSQDIPQIDSYFWKEYFDACIHKIIQTLSKIRDTKKRSKKPDATTTVSATTVSAATATASARDTNFIDIIETWKEKTIPAVNIKKLKKADLIRLQNMAENIAIQKEYIFEFLLLDFCEKIILSLVNKTSEYGFYLYTLLQLKMSSIPNINKYVLSFVDFITSIATENTNIKHVFKDSYEFIEKNKYLLKYSDVSLFNHQKQLFSLFKGKRDQARLVLYIAPTGTGKTMSPIGLSHSYKLIFVCVARHVGLALAKSAISMGKKVAFAFGCETASDIRLHYFSALSYSIHRKTGGIFKVDNSVGTNVEIMICDVKSYLTAMHYMLAFNRESDVITYWDEPTITMDYETHDLHQHIHNNWIENQISKVVLSCATLPKEDEIMDTISDFRSHFSDVEINTITSFDCRKSISLVNKNGKCTLPHLLFEDYDELMESVAYCQSNKTLLRYFDLKEIIRFLEYIDEHHFVKAPYTIDTYFTSISEITMNSIKLFYLEVISKIKKENWSFLYNYIRSTQESKFQDMSIPIDHLRKIKSVDSGISSTIGASPTITRTTSMCGLTSPTADVPPVNPSKGILLTTADAHTLTDGPTIFLVEDVDKIGKFYIQQSRIPEKIFKDIMDKIRDNESIQKKISVLEKSLEDTLGKEAEKERKMEKDQFKPEVKNIMKQMEALQQHIKSIHMEDKYIPNMKQHQKLWIPNGHIVDNAFVPKICDEVVKEIMATDVSNEMKLLLLLGIGVFVNKPNIQYMEIMKRLASEQKLYIIIAQSDYIYGTNYQLCHGFIGKDLTNMTQQKTIQAMGRIGRGNIQQEYTVRFRDDSIIKNLFHPTRENTEAVNMNKLFCAPDGYYDDYVRPTYWSDEEDDEKEIYRNGKLVKRRQRNEKAQITYREQPTNENQDEESVDEEKEESPFQILNLQKELEEEW